MMLIKSVRLFLSFTISLMLFSSASFALGKKQQIEIKETAEKLLNCNLRFGDTQEVRVYSQDDKLILWELTRYGSEVVRYLTKTEWKNKQIKIYTEYDWKKGILDERGDRWFFTHGNADPKKAGFTQSGFAQCY